MERMKLEMNRNLQTGIDNMEKRLLGFSLIEMLIVLSIFAVLGIVITQTLSSSLRGSKKSESVGLVRENAEQVFNVIERRLRGASMIDCNNSTQIKLQFYLVNDSAPHYFTCDVTTGIVSYDTQKLSSSNATTTCNFSPFCAQFPHYVTITVRASSPAAGSEGASYELSQKIYLRNYQ